jgi:uncharacterized protein YjbI with pentapeptide repeats
MTTPTPEIDTRDILGETLANARFEKVHFDSKFTGSNFVSVVFDRCRLDRVLMARTNWTNCDFRCSTLVAHFNDAVFEQCSFHDVTFKGLDNEYGGIRARFVNCDFSRAQFNQVRLRACRFQGCCFDGARFTKCDLRGALHDGEQMENTG